MRIAQVFLDGAGNWQVRRDGLDGSRPQVVFVFGERSRLENPSILADLQSRFTGARLLFASTSGEIVDTEVTEGGVVATALALEKTRIACAATTVRTQFESRSAGVQLATRLNAPDLAHVFVLSDGQRVNGTELTNGFNERLRPGATLTGGLAGDGSRFERTVVGLDEVPRSGNIVAVAFYGTNCQIGIGSSGGWQPVAGEYEVTRAQGNILFELDGQSALSLYKNHLGPVAAELPASALRFPLWVTPPDGSASVVRTILSVEDVTQSMVFAGDVPRGSRVQFMRAAHADLVAGATEAARQAELESPAELAICVSCVGRRLVMGNKTHEEVVGVRAVLGSRPVIAGFYSYGEMAPARTAAGCQLHNQTMTITTFREL